MKIRAITFDDVIVVHGHVPVSGGPSTSREQAFHEDDGWDIRETLPGTFTLCHETMSEPITIGGYGYSYVRSASQEAIAEPDAVVHIGRKGKRH
jgi:hypothetical protein